MGAHRQLRTVLNFLIHAIEVIPEPSTDSKALGDSILLRGKLLYQGELRASVLRVSLRRFCDMVSRTSWRACGYEGVNAAARKWASTYRSIRTILPKRTLGREGRRLRT